MTGVEIAVIAVAILLGIAILTGAVLFARKLDRDESGPTVYDPELYRGHNWYG
jgi:hypothetical protein